MVPPSARNQQLTADPQFLITAILQQTFLHLEPSDAPRRASFRPCNAKACPPARKLTMSDEGFQRFCTSHKPVLIGEFLPQASRICGHVPKPVLDEVAARRVRRVGGLPQPLAGTDRGGCGAEIRSSVFPSYTRCLLDCD